MSEEQTPVEPVPPASRLGEILGWSLPALAAACFIAAIIAIVRADAASQAVEHAMDAWDNALDAHSGHEAAARAAYMAAKAASREAALVRDLLMNAAFFFFPLIPGLIYAVRPSLVGGLVGRLLRPSSMKLAQRLPRRRHPVTFYQGIGLALMGIGWDLPNLLPAVGRLPGVPDWLSFYLILLAMCLFPICLLFAYPLLGQATWWYTSRQGAEREQEQSRA